MQRKKLLTAWLNRYTFSKVQLSLYHGALLPSNSKHYMYAVKPFYRLIMAISRPFLIRQKARKSPNWNFAPYRSLIPGIDGECGAL